jgi:RNA polymerase sigma-70 factor (ECF subfamily)
MVAATKIDAIAKGSERSYLLSTAYRIALRWRRPTARETVTDDEMLIETIDPGPSPEAMLDDAQARDLLDRVLTGMPLDLRTAFVLAEIDEQTTPQIAAILDLPLGTAASRLRRARQMFDERLTRLHDRMQERGGLS